MAECVKGVVANVPQLPPHHQGQEVILLRPFDKGGVRRLQCPEGFVYRFDKTLSQGTLEGWRCCMGRNCPGRIRVFAGTTQGVVFNANHRHDNLPAPVMQQHSTIHHQIPPQQPQHHSMMSSAKKSRTSPGDAQQEVVKLTESVSTKGNRLLEYNGHKYRFDKAHTQGPFESWRCVGGRNCPGRLKVRVGMLVATVTKDEHMHDSYDVRRNNSASHPLNLSVIRFQEKLSKTNSRLLSYNGYDYRFDKAHTGGPFESWRCVRGRNCPGRIKVKQGSCEGTITNDRHAHEPEDGSVVDANANSYKENLSNHFPPTMVPPVDTFSTCWPQQFLNHFILPMLNPAQQQQPQLSYPQVQYPQPQQQPHHHQQQPQPQQNQHQNQHQMQQQPMQMHQMQHSQMQMPPPYNEAMQQQNPQMISPPGEDGERRRKRKSEKVVKLEVI
ncbi:hypothetical protein L596_008841 [Steinernema carpocapsae]|uniref:FLYWCH-type domain-containing protein n=1 Tax=Steinernema carpocapsae TaxID=34508 RepID=A0A4U5PDZ1_STECR|nr:hypothetical protein L596_008841 [Steinernema carpocapsae]